MPVMVTLKCGGCDAEVTVGPLRRHFRGSHGDWGWGQWITPDVSTLTPEGWTMFDPWTQATYCKDCYAAIVGSDEEAVLS